MVYGATASYASNEGSTMPKDGWNNSEESDAHKLNEVIAQAIGERPLTGSEIIEKVKEAWGGELPRLDVRTHLRSLLKSKKNPKGGFVKREVRYSLTDLGRSEWAKYRAGIATARQKARKKSSIPK